MTPPEVRAGLPADPASAARARRFLDATLRGWQCDHLVEVASLLLSELVANAVLHAGTSILVVARVVDDRLRIEVHDDNPRMPMRKHYSATSATGRGLLLVERLAERWGSDVTPSGKVVWFELDSQPSSAPKGTHVFDFDDSAFDLEELSPGGGQAWGGKEGDGPAGGWTPRLQVLVSGRR